MGFRDFLKTIFKSEQKTSESKTLIETNLNDLGNLIEIKEKEINLEELKTLKEISSRIIEILSELPEKIGNLEKVNIKSIKTEEKIKLVVSENIKKYIENVNKLKNNIWEIINQELKEPPFQKPVKSNLKDFFKKLDLEFKNFETRSYLNYEKVTILVGKEISEITGVFKKISKQLKDSFSLSEDLIHEHETILNTKRNIMDIKRIDSFTSEIKTRLNLIDKKIQNFIKENLKLSTEIEEIRRSLDYLENLEKKKEVEKLLEGLEKEIYNLKGKIDFKELGNIFHSDEKKMRILKENKENFRDFFEKDCYSSLLRLIEEISDKSMHKEVLNTINTLIDKQKKIEAIKLLINEDNLTKKVFSFDRNKVEINNLEIEKEKILKNMEKIKQKRVEKVEKLSKDSKKIGIFLKI